MAPDARERFLATMHFGTVDRRPLWEWHYLEETVKRWHGEGLPAEVYLPEGQTVENKHCAVPLHRYFGLDRGQPYCPGTVELVPVNTLMQPRFGVQVLAEDEHTQTVRDADGVKKVVLKGISPAMPRFLEFPVQSRADFEAIIRRYDPADAARYPDDWDQFVGQTAERDYPLGLTFDGFFGRLRGWMGLEGLCYLIADDPDLVGAMCAFHADFILHTIERALREVQVDYINIWEDMAYKNGSLIAPEQVRRWMLPGYRQIADLARKHGVDVLFVDCDGNIEQLIPIWLQAGLNGVWPLEVAAGMDAVSLRQRYGQDLLLVGGIDKRELSHGKEQLREEVMRQVPALYAQGGYIPTVDHSVPPDIPFENYVVLRQLLRELSGAGGEL
jgi:hypothetical protein